ncbi:phylloplanin [Brachypodium distachyon]|uniref:Phylloplanin n=1 Tax=Brachypodium distachyon TaxID=15368 RepID=I1H5M8_BRADI|nr:phylloplanin [Brachypodium distachyon]KQK21756.1 hypothetical protein BRADI_1g62880v3 [Brachypodium distachyon]|eukprot:XP_003557948.1 phylloplanin [Brachypodium distachyon]
MAASKSLLLAAVLLVVIAGLGAEANKQAPLALVAGVVPCSAGSSINVAAVPAFPNADLQLVCGSTEIARATTDGSGAFNINLGKVSPSLLMPLLSKQCKVVVLTPLAACDVSLASVAGTLAAPVQLLGADSGSGSGGTGGLGGLGSIIGLIGQIVGGLLGGILNIVPLPFSLV